MYLSVSGLLNVLVPLLKENDFCLVLQNSISHPITRPAAPIDSTIGILLDLHDKYSIIMLSFGLFRVFNRV